MIAKVSVRPHRRIIQQPSGSHASKSLLRVLERTTGVESPLGPLRLEPDFCRSGMADVRFDTVLMGSRHRPRLLIQYPTQSPTPISTPISPTLRIPLSNNTPSTFGLADRKVRGENRFYVILSKLCHMYPANSPCQCRMSHQIG